MEGSAGVCGSRSISRSTSDCVTVKSESGLAIRSARALQRLNRVEARDLRVQPLFDLGVSVELVQAPVQHRQRMRDHVGSFPVFELVFGDLRGELLENRLSQRLMAGHHADLRQLQLALESRPSRKLARDFV